MKDENTYRRETFVVNTSFVLAYLFPDEKDRNVDAMFLKLEEEKVDFIAPYLLTFEVINGLRSAIVQKRQDLKKAEILIDSYLRIGINFEGVDEKGVLRLALAKSITTYDASYLWLAKRKKVKLLTLD